MTRTITIKNKYDCQIENISHRSVWHVPRHDTRIHLCVKLKDLGQMVIMFLTTYI